MRIDPNSLNSSLLALKRTDTEQEQLLEQLSTSRRVNRPSDSPCDAAAEVSLLATTARNTQYLSTVQMVQSNVQTIDSSLASAVTALTRAVALGTQGATGTLSQQNRDAIAREIRGIKEQVLAVANLNIQGSYVFAGSKTNTPAYVTDALSPSGVTYQGNTQIHYVEIGDGETLGINVPGSVIFSDPAADVFGALESLADALETNTAIPTALKSTQDALSAVIQGRVGVANILNRLSSAKDSLNARNVQLATNEEQLVGADMTSVISRLSKLTTARDAILAATAKSQNSLLDYLK